MTELEYMEKIEALRTQGRCSTSPDSARRYAAQLRAGSDLSQAFAAEALHNEQRREDVKRAMRKALHKMEDESVGPELRLDVARACVALEEEMEQRKAPVPSGDGEDPHGKANRGLAARCPKGGRAGTAVDRLSGGVGGDAVQPTGEPGNLRVRRTGKGKQCSFTVSGTACRNRSIR
ncbi:MAG: hypothetical protein J6E42_06900 [Firmicutes bacterium]|nr:hypothetical protein [Bacillota bacterium]